MFNFILIGMNIESEMRIHNFNKFEIINYKAFYFSRNDITSVYLIINIMSAATSIN